MAVTDPISKTPDEYIVAAIQRIQDSGSRLTDFNIGSATRTFIEGPAAVVSAHSLVIEQLRKDSYLATASGDALDLKAADYQVTRKAAQPATGAVTLERQQGGAAITIPAGWGDLATVPLPGQPSVSFQTTEDAVFDTDDLTITVPAIAVVGGQAGNIASGTKLLPTSPVNGFATDGGFHAASAFIGGVDEEADEALRARVPLEVAGRVKGRLESFLAGALRVPGVESAQVARAGETSKAGPAVAAGSVEVYYEGTVDLFGQVSSEVVGAAVANQAVTAFQADPEPITAALTGFYVPGTDTALLAQAIKDAIKTIVNAGIVGGTVHASACVEAVQAVDGLVSQNIPWADLRKTSAAPGTFADLVMTAGKYPVIDDASITVTLTELD